MTSMLLFLFAVLFQEDLDSKRCGAHCLKVALYALEYPDADIAKVDQLLGNPTERGYSLAQLQQTAEELSVNTRLVRTSLANLRRREPPFACLVPLHGDHFVLFGDFNGRDVWIVDPPEEHSLAAELINDRWDGTALLLSRSELVPEESLGPGTRKWLLVAVMTALAAVAFAVWRYRASFCCGKEIRVSFCAGRIDQKKRILILWLFTTHLHVSSQ